jgi:hypothetical protein
MLGARPPNLVERLAFFEKRSEAGFFLVDKMKTMGYR